LTEGIKNNIRAGVESSYDMSTESFNQTFGGLEFDYQVQDGSITNLEINKKRPGFASLAFRTSANVDIEVGGVDREQSIMTLLLLRHNTLKDATIDVGGMDG